MTESPRRNLYPKQPLTITLREVGAGLSYILLMNLSLLTALPGLPLASLGFSVHISLTFSRTMLQ